MGVVQCSKKHINNVFYMYVCISSQSTDLVHEVLRAIQPSSYIDGQSSPRPCSSVDTRISPLEYPSHPHSISANTHTYAQ